MRHGAIACAGLVLLGCGAENAAPPARRPAPDIPALMAAANAPGLSIATIDDCELSDVSHYGVADIETGEPVDDTTRFEAASLTKTIFSLIVNQLADEGVIDLDHPIADNFDYPRVTDKDAYAVLTPRMILAHRSGLPNWAGDPLDAETWGDIPFNNPPDTQFGYSGEAYQLLQAYVENVTGKSLDVLFAERLGDLMPLSSLSVAREDASPSFGHDKDGGKEKGRAIGELTSAGAAYSGQSNARDYARFLSHLCEGAGMSADARDAMLEPQSPTDAPEIAWALGWGVQTGENPVYFHWGDNGPFKAFTAFNRETGDGVVYFANAMNGLMLIEPIAAPVVGDVGPIVDWLDYGRVD
ncbi:serine hydrolase domain-containing protein [Hyphococcus sp.]|uniref:serine hydrolase domain-containing protein n=1 Tax=Hyphococcus sp. TaxID=2038636 RepID=UPI003CCB8B9F